MSLGVSTSRNLNPNLISGRKNTIVSLKYDS
jgi:hypothetical protein